MSTKIGHAVIYISICKREFTFLFTSSLQLVLYLKFSFSLQILLFILTMILFLLQKETYHHIHNNERACEQSLLQMCVDDSRIRHHNRTLNIFMTIFTQLYCDQGGLPAFFVFSEVFLIYLKGHVNEIFTQLFLFSGTTVCTIL